jgi:hypothetical protein
MPGGEPECDEASARTMSQAADAASLTSAGNDASLLDDCTGEAIDGAGL